MRVHLEQNRFQVQHASDLDPFMPLAAAMQRLALWTIHCCQRHIRPIRRFGLAAGWAVLQKRLHLCGVARSRIRSMRDARSHIPQARQ